MSTTINSGADVNSVEVGIVIYTDTLENLVAANEVFLRGQLILAETVNGVGIKRGDWYWKTQPKSAGTPFNDLPWIVSPDQSGSDRMSTFRITNTSVNGGIPQYSYDADNGSVTLTDARFKGKQDFPVISSNYGSIRASQLTYDPNLGKVTITGIAPLEDDEHFDVFIPTGITTDPDYVALNARMDALEAFNAEFFLPLLPSAPGLPGMTSFFYMGDMALLEGTRWELDTVMQGKYPMGILTTDPDFNKTPGTSFGSKFFKITSTDQLPWFRLYTVVDQFLNQSGHPTGRLVNAVRSMIRYFFKADGGGAESYELVGSAAENTEPTLSPTSSIGKTIPDDIKHIPPSVAGNWIRWKA